MVDLPALCQPMTRRMVNLLTMLGNHSTILWDLTIRLDLRNHCAKNQVCSLPTTALHLAVVNKNTSQLVIFKHKRRISIWPWRNQLAVRSVLRLTIPRLSTTPPLVSSYMIVSKSLRPMGLRLDLVVITPCKSTIRLGILKLWKLFNASFAPHSFLTVLSVQVQLDVQCVRHHTGLTCW